jgi:phospholipase D1/2
MNLFSESFRKKKFDDQFSRRYYENVENEAFQESIEEMNDKKSDLPKLTELGYYTWIGKDYSNVYYQEITRLDDHANDQFSREDIPRMPWRDAGVVFVGESARDLARHFIQRWNQTKKEQVSKIDSYPYLIPKGYCQPIEFFNFNWLNQNELFHCNIQVTRSVDDWSAGVFTVEHSILNAYIDLIQASEHYIYIENQFFITTTDPIKDDKVKNTIGLELVNRIVKAHKNNELFKVYIVLPLLPGFEKMNTIKAVQYYNLKSIKFGEYSIYNRLKKEGILDPTEYITFHGMRNWSVLMGKLVQEIIYVHSKLMIVDDKYVICGSANINDRSLLGKRDSEIACVIKDEELFDSKLNGKQVKVGKYAHSLRTKIFKYFLYIFLYRVYFILRRTNQAKKNSVIF